MKIQESFISVRGALLFFKISLVAVFFLTFRFQIFFFPLFSALEARLFAEVLPFLC